MKPAQDEDPASQHQHPMRVVMRRTGLNADLIRVWEKRYGVVRPVRTPSGRRLYSDAEIERLRLLYRATLAGRSIGQVANLTTPELATLVERDESAERPLPGSVSRGVGSVPTGASVSPFLEESLAAIEDFDAATLDSVLRRAAMVLPATAFLDELMTLLLHRVSSGSLSESLHPVHVRLSLVVMRRALDRVLESVASPRALLHAVVAAPAGVHNEPGALLAAATAATHGWRVTYLGAGLAAEDLAEAVRRTKAEVLLLSVTEPAGDGALVQELRRLGALLPEGSTLMVGGAAAPSYGTELEALGGSVVEDLAALRERLQAGGFG